jgi:AcrR family transcriptional regulator
MGDRLTAADFCREAIALLAETGELTIAMLCDRLGITKGSFYHHFAGLPEFVEQLARYWEQVEGEQLTGLARAEAEPTLRFAVWMEFCAGLPHAAEAAIREWGREYPSVAEAVNRVDRRRERYVGEAVAALGADRGRARILARIALAVLIGAQQCLEPVDERRLRQMFEELERLAFAEADGRLAARMDVLTGG